MGEVTIELEQAIKTLNFSRDIIDRTDIEFNKKLYFTLLEKFVEGKDRRWWWEAFKKSFQFQSFDYPPEHFNAIIPNLNQHVWFMIEDDHESFYPIYDVDPKFLKSILDECFGFEYYIINKKQTWLLCENHHNILIGIGEGLRSLNLHLIESDNI